MAVVEGFGTTCAETRFSSNHALQGPLCDKWRCNAGSRQAAVDVRQNRSLSALGYLGVESRFPWWTCSTTKIPKATPYRLVFFARFPMCWCRFRARPRERHPFEPRVFTTATPLCSLWWSRERAPGRFLYWCEFWDSRLWLATPGQKRPRVIRTRKKHPKAVAGAMLDTVTRVVRALASGRSSRWVKGGA